MVSLTVVGESFTDPARDLLRSVSAQLALALAETAPKGCVTEILDSDKSTKLKFKNPRVLVENVAVPPIALAALWLTGAPARQFDGNFIHSLTPLAPIRQHREYDGSQATVTVPNLLAWHDASPLPRSAKLAIRAYVQRAVKFADRVVTCDFATADALREIYGDSIRVAVLPLAAPREFTVGSPSTDIQRIAAGSEASGADPVAYSALSREERDERAASLGLPAEYLLTTASFSDFERLQWAADAVLNNGKLPPLVVVTGCGSVSASDAGASAGEELSPELQELVRISDGRIVPVTPEHLTDIGVLLSGATAFVLPQQHTAEPFSVYGALENRVPVFYASENKAVADITLEAGCEFTDAADLEAKLAEHVLERDTLDRLRLLADDRADTFSWQATARALWELHANI